MEHAASDQYQASAMPQRFLANYFRSVARLDVQVGLDTFRLLHFCDLSARFLPHLQLEFAIHLESRESYPCRGRHGSAATPRRTLCYIPRPTLAVEDFWA